ncbi:MAG TPA: hypothetical protein VH333_00700 [Pseudonocardiaceae bacterium]|jgi:hypothetical protein|nr:hypothetical protein [Pseudonocardiaceae bacterium]
MPELIVIRHDHGDAVTLSEGTLFYLDRTFLTGGEQDTRLHRRKHAPMLLSLDGDWLLVNQSPERPLTVEDEEGHFLRVSPQKVCLIPVGFSTLKLGPFTVGIEFMAEDSLTPLTLDGPTTSKFDRTDQALDVVSELLERRPELRTIMYVRYQAFLSDRPEDVDKPRTLTAGQVLDCFPVTTIHRVNEAQRKLKHITGRDKDELGQWLVDNGLLTTRLRDTTPHVHCDHRKPVRL